MAATIATLSDLGWNPVSPYTWKQPRGSPRNSGFEPDGFIEWNYVGGDTSSVHEAFTEDIENQLWKTAATHRHGRGLERGGDLTAGVKHIEWYRKKGLIAQAAMLTTVLCGAVWSTSRTKESKPETEVVCPLCGQNEDDEYHTAYKCSGLPADVDWNMGTRGLVRAAEKGHIECPALWLRGINPANCVEIPEAKCEYRDKSFGPLEIDGGDLFSDGSGGVHTSDPRIRRSGSAFIQVTNSNGKYVVAAGGFAPLGGKRQTVPRAELNAAIMALKRCRYATKPIRLWVDCKGILDGFEAGENNIPQTNVDLWKGLWAVVHEIRVKVEMRKVWRAHATVEDHAVGLLSTLEFFGNAAVDRLAGHAAAEHQVSELIKEQLDQVDGRAWNIQTRLVEAQLAHAKAYKEQTSFSRNHCDNLGLDHTDKGQATRARKDNHFQLQCKLASRGHAPIEGIRGKRRTIHCATCGISSSPGQLANWVQNDTGCLVAIIKSGVAEPVALGSISVAAENELQLRNEALGRAIIEHKQRETDDIMIAFNRAADQKANQQPHETSSVMNHAELVRGDSARNGERNAGAIISAFDDPEADAFEEDTAEAIHAELGRTVAFTEEPVEEHPEEFGTDHDDRQLKRRISAVAGGDKLEETRQRIRNKMLRRAQDRRRTDIANYTDSEISVIPEPAGTVRPRSNLVTGTDAAGNQDREEVTHYNDRKSLKRALVHQIAAQLDATKSRGIDSAAGGKQPASTAPRALDISHEADDRVRAALNRLANPRQGNEATKARENDMLQSKGIITSGKQEGPRKKCDLRGRHHSEVQRTGVRQDGTASASVEQLNRGKRDEGSIPHITEASTSSTSCTGAYAPPIGSSMCSTGALSGNNHRDADKVEPELIRGMHDIQRIPHDVGERTGSISNNLHHARRGTSANNNKTYEGIVVYAGKRLHNSHHFGFLHGIIWCWNCGFWCVQATGNLETCCKRKPSKAGDDALARLARGLTPRSTMLDWPAFGMPTPAGVPVVHSPACYRRLPSTRL